MTQTSSTSAELTPNTVPTVSDPYALRADDSLSRLRSYRDGLSGGEATDRLKAGGQRYHHADTTLVITVRAVRWRTHTAPSFNVLTDWSEDPGAKAFSGFQPSRERSGAGQIKRT